MLSTIRPGDTVYFLGDLVFGQISRWRKYLEELTSRGTWHFVRGNHDKKKSDREFLDCGFATVQDFVILESKWGRALLSHYPLRNHDERYFEIVRELGYQYLFNECVVNIHGHTHSFSFDEKQFVNVSVEARGFGPLLI